MKSSKKTSSSGKRQRAGIVVPKTYGGRWIAWNGDQTEIIAHAATPSEAQAAARAAGENDSVLEWVPPADRRLIGAGR
jgi:hypothetical protein